MSAGVLSPASGVEGRTAAYTVLSILLYILLLFQTANAGMASDKVEIAPNTSKSHNDKFITEPIVTEPHSDSGSNSHDGGMNDVEKHGANRESLPVPDLKRKLKSRHLQMIAIGLFSILFGRERQAHIYRWHNRNWSLHW